MGLSTVSQLKCLQIWVLNAHLRACLQPQWRGYWWGYEVLGVNGSRFRLQAPGEVKHCIPKRVEWTTGNESDSSKSFNNLLFLLVLLWTMCLLNLCVAESFEAVVGSKHICFPRLCPIYLRQLRSCLSRDTSLLLYFIVCSLVWCCLCPHMATSLLSS